MTNRRVRVLVELEIEVDDGGAPPVLAQDLRAQWRGRPVLVCHAIEGSFNAGADAFDRWFRDAAPPATRHVHWGPGVPKQEGAADGR